MEGSPVVIFHILLPSYICLMISPNPNTRLNGNFSAFLRHLSDCQLDHEIILFDLAFMDV